MATKGNQGNQPEKKYVSVNTARIRELAALCKPLAEMNQAEVLQFLEALPIVMAFHDIIENEKVKVFGAMKPHEQAVHVEPKANQGIKFFLEAVTLAGEQQLRTVLAASSKRPKVDPAA